MIALPIQPRTIADVEAHPPCLSCGGPVLRRPDEQANKWRLRATCSPRCRSRHHALIQLGRTASPSKPHPPCANPECGGPVEQRDGETAKRWRSRRCCSLECAHRTAELAGQVQAAAPRAPAMDRVELAALWFGDKDVRTTATGRIAAPPPTFIPRGA